MLNKLRVMRSFRPLCLAVSFALLLGLAVPASAASVESQSSLLKQWLSGGSNVAEDTWLQGANEVYLPVHTYHMRFAYSDAKVRRLNENPWGFGLGRTLVDSSGNEHRLYAMAFKDSHFQVEPIAGYARLWQVAHGGPFALKAGFTAFLTSRGDTLHYMPFPAILPLVSVEAGRLSLMSTYIPGGRHSGNVWFAFASYRLAH
ncbi:lipid IV(A) palmitoyltransferase PagP [Burkholderia cenocepacia]|uniref:lipid IV(A) palmitoyltransferase PagP n=1 Tax=Burkholderia cenocepacia TaxID=95486 RepID=UPI00076216FC|nr:lipid IV(A) palmitoyltransferase PagP [Burkholderia cenocepacia]KWU17906.1 hypothetical protein AS149_14620 [Burkholderia cenocepacia]